MYQDHPRATLPAALDQGPLAPFRSMPFWALNDKLTAPELRRQIAEFRAQGYGGFFLHARVGLVTPYLSQEWMAMIRLCCEEAARQGLEAWLYDEDRWPSGFAGGIVPRRNPAWRAHNLLLRAADTEPAPGGEETLLMTCSWNDREYHIVSFRHDLGHPSYNGACYVDLLNPEVVAAFLAETHERYRQIVGEHFGTTVPGIFTDEPQLNHRAPRGMASLPWSPLLPEAFHQEHGWDLLAELPALFFPLPGYRRIRFAFNRCVARCFREAFTRPYAAWCAQHGLHMTGHFLAEDQLALQTHHVGDVMSHYALMQRPGVDILARYTNQVVVLKQVASVAAQLAKPRVLSEAYACSGQQAAAPFFRKWMSGPQILGGINHFCTHGTLYSMRGTRKRDFPPNVMYQQPFWPQEQFFSQYQARLCQLASQGSERARILVMQPLSSVWCEHDPCAWDPQRRQPDAVHDLFEALSIWLMAQRHGFHYANETLLEDHGRVEGCQLCIGQRAYDLLILPACRNLHRSSLELVQDFRAAGGRVLLLGERPTSIDGVATPIDWQGCEHCADPQALHEFLPPAPVQVISRRAGSLVDDCIVRVQDLAEGRLYLLHNISEQHWQEVRVVLTEESATPLAVIDPATDACYRIDDADLEAIDLAPAGTLVLLTGAPAAEGIGPAPRHLGSGCCLASQLARSQTLLGPCSVRRLDPNCLPLREATIRIGDAPERCCTISDIHQLFMGLPSGTPFTASYRFTCLDDLRGAFAAIECAEHLATIDCDGQPLTCAKAPGLEQPFDPELSWLDVHCSRVALPPLAPGAHVLTISGYSCNNVIGDNDHCPVADPATHYPVELEDIFICGDFSVVHDTEGGFLISTQDHMEARDLTGSGLPFYAGTVACQTTFSCPVRPNGPLWLCLDGIAAATALILVNGQQAACLLWEPWAVDIAPWLQAGDNTIEMRLSSTLVNAYGPSRQPDILSQRAICPGHFYHQHAARDELVAFGLGQALIRVPA